MNHIPQRSNTSFTPSDSKSILTPAASRISALPHNEEEDLFPCCDYYSILLNYLLFYSLLFYYYILTLNLIKTIKAKEEEKERKKPLQS